MDIGDVVLGVFVALCFIALGSIVGAAIVDARTNGFNDCRDSPEYCETVEEYKHYWPEYQIPLDSIESK